MVKGKPAPFSAFIICGISSSLSKLVLGSYQPSHGFQYHFSLPFFSSILLPTLHFFSSSFRTHPYHPPKKKPISSIYIYIYIYIGARDHPNELIYVVSLVASDNEMGSFSCVVWVESWTSSLMKNHNVRLGFKRLETSWDPYPQFIFCWGGFVLGHRLIASLPPLPWKRTLNFFHHQQ